MKANCNSCNKVVEISEEKFYTTETIVCDECIICNCPGLPSYIEIAENECLACKKPIKNLNK